MNGRMAHPRIHGAIHGAENMGEKIEDLRPVLHIFVPDAAFMPSVAALIAFCALVGFVVRHF